MTSATDRRVAMIRLVILGVGVSTFGSGLVFPYLAIYLVRSPRGGLGVSGAFYAVVAVVGFLAAVVVATRRTEIDRWRLALAGLTAAALGYAGLVLHLGLSLVLLSAVIVGIGQASYGASLTPILNALSSEGERRGVFARRYRAMNAGLALGAATAGTLVSVFGSGVIVWLVALDALSFTPLLVIMTLGRRLQLSHPLAPDRLDVVRGRLARRDVPFALLFFQLAAYAFGFSQLEAVAPLAATRLMHVRLSVAALLLLVNAATVIALQKPVTQRLGKHSEVVGLQVMVGLWFLSFVTVSLCSLGSTAVRVAGLVVFAAVFAAGECAYSCSYHPLLMRSVPEAHQVRASALSNAVTGTGSAVGPVVGTILVGVGSAPLLWAVMALGSVSSAIPLVSRRRIAADRPRSLADVPA